MGLTAYMGFSDCIIINALKTLEADKRQVSYRQILAVMEVPCSQRTLTRFVEKMERIGKLKRYDWLPGRGCKYEIKLD